MLRDSSAVETVTVVTVVMVKRPSPAETIDMLEKEGASSVSHGDKLGEGQDPCCTPLLARWAATQLNVAARRITPPNARLSTLPRPAKLPLVKSPACSDSLGDYFRNAGSASRYGSVSRLDKLRRFKVSQSYGLMIWIVIQLIRKRVSFRRVMISREFTALLLFEDRRGSEGSVCVRADIHEVE